ncbi:cellulose synthase [Nocardioides guangzhouensis]|uniref:Cellulose synthase n=1 Tax=Nocardioides guangzhouensis TaxID=2497878 RepID=A0A4Q4ZF63_9ACTN|nr:cellulose synthase [Nocardioides guangzhouensis]RYP86046.1 cellulose synthase [Nocardioides guangzhouensis]
MLDDAAWLALTAALTVLGALYTVRAGRKRGSAAAVRGVAITLLPPAAFLTGTLELVTDVTTATVDWATGLVFNPFMWFGLVLAGLSVVLFGVSSRMSGRQQAQQQKKSGGAVSAPATGKGLPPSSGRKAEPIIDDDLADIEAILKKRGIT